MGDTNIFRLIRKSVLSVPSQALTLHQLTPQPKTVVILDKGHMHPRKPELTRELVKISREWLLERGLVN